MSRAVAHGNREAIVAAAIGWALARMGDRSYALRCLAFVEDAYERPNEIELIGSVSAAESAALLGATDPLGAVRAAPGSLIFYSATGPIQGEMGEWGHVGLALGDGTLVHAWDEVRVDRVEDVERLTPAVGWSAPCLQGWVSPERVLAGHRLRDWSRA